MKIIDLLNKIANGEEVPKQIKLKGIEPVFQYDNKEFYYYWKDTKTGKGGKATLDLIYNINDEVEIIEEDKKIEKLEQYYDKDLDEYVVETYINGIYYKEIYKSKYDEMIIKKISELIDEVNKMKEGK